MNSQPTKATSQDNSFDNKAITEDLKLAND